MSDLPPSIYSEAEVPDYDLPALETPEKTTTLFADHVFGHFPTAIPRCRVELIEESRTALDGLACRRQLRVTLSLDDMRSQFDLLLYTPATILRPPPIFLGLNFSGNHAVHPDQAIVLPGSWCPDNEKHGVVAHRATEAGRGVQASRWPIETILKRGYGVATVYCGDFAPDDPGHVHEGVLKFYEKTSAASAGARGGAVSAWAWGLSRAMDALAGLPDIDSSHVDSSRVAVVGFSRLGKAALWAGACDKRFAMVVSTNSGSTGAALARRRIGERLIHINGNFPHWFAKNYHSYNEREQDLPIDQHQLLALIAPRSLYVASAVEDKWADPYGEYLALAAAAPAWGAQLPKESPAVDKPLHLDKLGYHVRSGRHAITAWDWLQYLAFTDQFWKIPSSAGCR